MRRTLRRSCALCAKAKHKCDLQTPKCSRCISRKLSCSYANEPLNSGTGISPSVPDTNDLIVRPRAKRNTSSGLLTPSAAIGARVLDPFNTFPATSLPASRVQVLMHNFLSKIAFEYYPLDLNASTNPFVVSWWPLALADPTLFNVSLQTASLDDELRAQKGFRDSETLMRDAVTLMRQKIEDPTLAFQDTTMDAVITLAAIEHGKGNYQQASMHINAVKRMVAVRGGISVIKQTAPLTARMVPWVAMLLLGSPQFEAQDGFGFGNGVEPIFQWRLDYLDVIHGVESTESWTSDLDSHTRNVLIHLRYIFSQNDSKDEKTIQSFPNTDDLHDLTCYVLHRLLLPSSDYLSPFSECIRYSVAIYMLLIHGPTYYSHAQFLGSLTLQLQGHLKALPISTSLYPTRLWCSLAGILSSSGTNENEWFQDYALALSATMGLQDWNDAQTHLRSVLWDEHRSGTVFRAAWKQIISCRSRLLMDAT